MRGTEVRESDKSLLGDKDWRDPEYSGVGGVQEQLWGRVLLMGPE